MTNKDIAFVERYKLSFTKTDWSESEIDLIRSLGFKIAGQVIIVDLTCTCKRSLWEFMTTCFRHIMVGPQNKATQDWLYGQLAIRYGELHKDFDSRYLSILPYHKKLYKHQKEAIYYSASRKYSLLSLEQGLGKTITAASVSVILNFKKTLVICPAIVKWNWLRDLSSEVWGFSPMLFTIMDSVSRRSVKAFQEKYVIINYDILEKYNKELMEMKFDHVILDEIQNCKNTGTRKFKNTLAIIKNNPDAKVTMLSGTPIKNRINDMFSYLKMAEHNLGKNHAKFLRNYTHYTTGRMGLRVTGGKNLDLLYKHLTNFVIRKTEKECLDLPDKIVNKYYFKLEEWKREYDAAIAEMAKSKDISNIHSSLHTLNIITVKSKIQGIIELAEEIISQGRKPIIFSGYNEPLTILEDHFKERCVRIDGSVNAYERDQLITRFKTDPTCEIFIANIIAGGVGINLTNSSDVIFTNFPFSPTDVDQAIARVYRIGQVEKVKVYFMICEESIDENLFDLITDKSRDINALVNRNHSVQDMGSITDKLFKQLLEKYRINNLKTNETTTPEKSIA